MAVATPTNQQGLGQLIVKCDRQLISIQASIAEAETALAAKLAELESLSSRQAARDQQLQIAAQSVGTTRSELEAQRLKAKLSEGTLASEGEDSIKTLEKRLLRLEKEEHELKVKLTKEASTDANREAAARIAIDQVQELILSLAREQETTQQARQSAFNDLGQAKKQMVLSRLKELHENITRTRTEAASAVLALDAYAG
jgi:hypothetical protein